MTGSLWRSCAGTLVLGLAVVLTGCATVLPPRAEQVSPSDSVAFGRVVVTQSSTVRRIAPAALRFFELVHQETGARYRVDVQSADAELVLRLPAGRYELSRVLINEGAFQALAAPGPTFRVEAGQVNYVGTWRLDVRSPAYDRRMTLSIVNELEPAAIQLRSRYPDLATRTIASHLPAPAESVTRLYETDPYPLIWWFKRHHTT